MTSLDWAAWYTELLDGLEAAIEAADIEWATDAEGNPWVVRGQRRPAGIGHPHAMVLQFRKTRDDANSTRSDELHQVRTSVAVIREGDPQQPEQNLTQAVRDMAAVENALYADRSLGGACDYLTVEESNAFDLENNQGSTETVGDVQVEITKDADL